MMARQEYVEGYTAPFTVPSGSVLPRWVPPACGRRCGWQGASTPSSCCQRDRLSPRHPAPCGVGARAGDAHAADAVG